MVSLNPLKWGKNKNEPTEMEQALRNAIAVQSQGESTSESERAKQLAENSLLMVDENRAHFLEGLCTYTVPDVDLVTGEIKVNPETKQAIMLQKINPKYVALGLWMSPLIRGSYLDRRDVVLGQIRARCGLRRIKMKMSERDYENGGALIIDAATQDISVDYSCALNGRMALITKATSKSTEIRIGKTSEAKS